MAGRRYLTGKFSRANARTLFSRPSRRLMARVLYFDCFSGISGDMILGAFLDAGLPFDDLKRALGSLAMPGYDIRAERVIRAGVSATKFSVDEHGKSAAAEQRDAHAHDSAHRHDHAHGHDHVHDDRHPHDHRHAHDHEHSQHPEHLHAHGHSHEHSRRHDEHNGHEHRTLPEIYRLI